MNNNLNRKAIMTTKEVVEKRFAKLVDISSEYRYHIGILKDEILRLRGEGVEGTGVLRADVRQLAVLQAQSLAWMTCLEQDLKEVLK